MIKQDLQVIDNAKYSPSYWLRVERRLNEVTYPFEFTLDVERADYDRPEYSHTTYKISEKSGKKLTFQKVNNEWAQSFYDKGFDGTLIIFNDTQWRRGVKQDMGGERTDPLNGHYGICMTASNEDEMVKRLSHELRHCITRDFLKVEDDTHDWDYKKKDLKGGWKALEIHIKDMIDWNSDEDILTRTLVGEYGHGTEEEMFAVGCVIRNRAWNRSGFSSTVRGVCLQPYQFSCWNLGTPDRVRLVNMNKSSYVYQKANKIAKRVLAGEADITRNADHYLNLKVTKQLYGKIPTWVDPSRKTVDVGEHSFYNLQGEWKEREATTKEPLEKLDFAHLAGLIKKMYTAKLITKSEALNALKVLLKIKHAE